MTTEQPPSQTTSQATSTSRPRYVNPFPDVSGVYLLIAGILLGVIFGPAVLGRFSPSTYQHIFIGGVEETQQLNEQQAKTDEQLHGLEDTGVTDTAVDEHLLTHELQLVALKANVEKAQRDRMNELIGWTAALMLAVIAIMLIESLISPDVSESKSTQIPAALGRLITARYALAALWIALSLAQPSLLNQLPLLFLALLVIVALVAALMPLGKARS